MLCAPVTYDIDAAQVRDRADQMMVEAAADARGHPRASGSGSRRPVPAPGSSGRCGCRRCARLRVAVPRLVRAPAGLQQEPARDRRRPGGRVECATAGTASGRSLPASPSRCRRPWWSWSCTAPTSAMEILLRGVTCHVMRAIPFRSRLSLNAGRLLSKSTVQAFGLPAFLLNHMPGTVLSAPVWR